MEGGVVLIDRHNCPYRLPLCFIILRPLRLNLILLQEGPIRRKSNEKVLVSRSRVRVGHNVRPTNLGRTDCRVCAEVLWRCQGLLSK